MQGIPARAAPCLLLPVLSLRTREKRRPSPTQRPQSWNGDKGQEPRWGGIMSSSIPSPSCFSFLDSPLELGERQSPGRASYRHCGSALGPRTRAGQQQSKAQRPSSQDLVGEDTWDSSGRSSRPLWSPAQ